jgi:predicted Fe-S protein YdhL (DUF1289 family)
MSRGVQSPCIHVCRFPAPEGWCEGCGRPRQEANAWFGMTPFQRGRIERALPARLARLRGRRQPPG